MARTIAVQFVVVAFLTSTILAINIPSDAVLRMCRRPPDPGTHDCIDGGNNSVLKRWHYDESLQTCRPFAYNGCDGNANRFESKNECLATCRGVRPCNVQRQRPAPDGCRSIKITQITDGCPHFHWDCPGQPRVTHCPPFSDIAAIPADCQIRTVRTISGCSLDIVDCS